VAQADDIYWDNRMSPSFPGVDGYVFAVTEFNGQLVIAGSFTRVGSVPASNIAVWDGSEWLALGTGLRYDEDQPGEASALTVFDGRLYAGGRFRLAGGVAVDAIAAWDGHSWSAVGSGDVVSDQVTALTVYNNTLVAGGHLVATWNGASWSDLGLRTATYDYLGSLLVVDGKLIACGGNQLTTSGHTFQAIASWDGSTWSGLGDGLDHDAFALAVYEGKLIAGGFEGISSWDGAVWSELESPGHVVTLATYDDRLIAATFQYAPLGGVLGHLAAWDGSSWTDLASQPVGEVDVLGVIEGDLIVGGVFSAIGETAGQGIASWDGTSWSSFNPADTGLNGPISDFAAYDGRLVCAGAFSVAGDAVGNHVAAWDGVSWSRLGAGANYPVQALAVHDGALVAGGTFTTAGGASANHLATWNGTSWSELGGGAVYPVAALTVHGNDLIAAWQNIYDDCVAGVAGCGGYATIHAWNGSTWANLGGQLYDFARSLLVYHDQLILLRNVEGNSIPYSPPRGSIDVWDGTSWSALNSQLAWVGGATIYEGRLLVGEMKWSSSNPNQIASWDGESWAIQEGDFNGMVTAVTVFDHKLIAGGEFTMIGGTPANHIAAWDGQSWSALGSGTNGPVTKLAVYGGRLVVAGDFQNAGGKTAFYVAEWTKVDTREVAVDILPGSCTNPLNDNHHTERAQGVLPVAILGGPDFDVNEIEPSSIRLNGTNPLRWSYEDVATPADKTEDDCACTEEGADGYADLSLKFSRAAVTGLLSPGDVDGGASPRPAARGQQTIRVEGQLRDGSAFEGYDCVTLVGKQVAPLPAGGMRVTNRPNPFGRSTRITFTLPEPARVRAEVYNVLGERVALLLDENREAGEQVVLWDGSRAAAGIYYCRIQAGSRSVTTQMLLLK